MLKTAIRGWSPHGCSRLLTRILLVMTTSEGSSHRTNRKNVFLAMKLTVFFLTAALLNVSAKGISQNVTFSGKNISLEKVFNVVEKQTGYYFFYPENTLAGARSVTINAKDQPLLQFLETLFANQPLKYSIESRTISVSVVKATDGPDGGKQPVQQQLVNALQDPFTGRIVDESGQPLAGASLAIKKGRILGQTDLNGNFNIEVSSGDVLVISFVGYEPLEYKVTRVGQPVSLVLKHLESKLDEVQIVAYGRTSQRNSVGNIATVSGEDIARSPVNNPLLALSGRVPGMNINQQTGFSGSGVITLLQGQNSIIKGSDPFFVVDGVPYPSQNLSVSGELLGVSGVNTYTRGSTLAFINPADIESITVLKDADATAIYGSRAANGAILITTKKGKQGKSRLSLDHQQGVGKVPRKLDLMNTQQYVAMRKEAIQNDGLTIQPTDYDVNGFWDTTRYTDWQKEYIGGTANYMTTSATLSGGSANTQYRVGGTFHQETTVMPGDFKDQKGSLHFNVNTASDNNKFKAELSGSYMVDNNRLSNYDLTQVAVITPPNAPKSYNDDGSLNFMPTQTGFSSFLNPLAYLNQKYSMRTNNLVSNLVLNYTILPGLNLRGSLGYTNMQSTELVELPLSSYPPEYRPYYQRIGLYGNYNINTWIAEPQLTYNRQLGPGPLDALIGGSIQRNNSTGSQIAGIDYSSDEVIKDINSAVTLTSNAIVNNIYKYAGAFGRINYIYNDKYIINLSARRDGTSRFGEKNRFHDFAAIGLGWTFSKERFISDNLSFLSFGKLRASYGTTGNDQIGDYAYINLYTPLVTGVPYRGISSLVSRGIANPYLQWEETRKLNVGLDLGFINDRIIFNANYYQNRSSNQLMSYQMPIITGVTGVLTNYPATVQNSGWEFSVNSTVIRQRPFRWSVNANLTIPRNKLIKFDNLETSSYANNLVVGQPISITKLFRYAGVNPQTGQYQFVNKEGEITPSPAYFTDQIVIGNSSPKWYAGVGSSLSYGGFSLDFLVQYMKRDGPAYFTGANFPGYNGLNQPAWLLDRWTKPGDVAAHQRYYTDYSLSEGYGYASNSDAAFTDASYCRLKNLSLGWQLPAGWVNHAKIANARLYVQGQNLLTITNYKGLDPETLSSVTLPPLRVFVIGLQIGL